MRGTVQFWVYRPLRPSRLPHFLARVCAVTGALLAAETSALADAFNTSLECAVHVDAAARVLQASADAIAPHTKVTGVLGGPAVPLRLDASQIENLVHTYAAELGSLVQLLERGELDLAKASARLGAFCALAVTGMNLEIDGLEEGILFPPLPGPPPADRRQTHAAELHFIALLRARNNLVGTVLKCPPN